MIKWLLRLIAFPVMIILTILEWSGTYILHFAGMLCRLIAGMIFTLAVASYLTGLASGEEVMNTLVAGVAFFLIPRIGVIPCIPCWMKYRIPQVLYCHTKILPRCSFSFLLY